MEHIGKHCHRWRIRAGITAAHVARTAGVTNSTVTRFERHNADSNWLLYVYLKLGMPFDEGLILNYLGGIWDGKEK